MEMVSVIHYRFKEKLINNKSTLTKKLNWLLYDPVCYSSCIVDKNVRNVIFIISLESAVFVEIDILIKIAQVTKILVYSHCL